MQLKPLSVRGDTLHCWLSLLSCSVNPKGCWLGFCTDSQATRLTFLTFSCHSCNKAYLNHEKSSFFFFRFWIWKFLQCRGASVYMVWQSALRCTWSVWRERVRGASAGYLGKLVQDESPNGERCFSSYVNSGTFCYFPHRALVLCFTFWSVARSHSMDPAFLHSDRESQRDDSESLSSCLKVHWRQRLTTAITYCL